MMRGAVPLAVIVALLAAGTARAGTYQVNACAGGADHRAWVPFSSTDAAFDITPGCPFTAITATSASARAGFFEAAWWRFTAPPGTSSTACGSPATATASSTSPTSRRTASTRAAGSRGLHRGRADHRRLHARGLHDARGQLPLRLGLQGPGRGGRVRPRRLADHLPGGVHPRVGLPQRQRQRVPARRRDDLQRRRDDPRRRRPDAAGRRPAAGRRLAASHRRAGRHRVGRERDQRAHGHPGRHASDAVQLHAPGALRERLRGAAGAERTGRRRADGRRHRQGRGGQPGDRDAHGQRRRHAAVGAAAAAVGAHADRRRRRHGLGRRRRPDLRRRRRRCRPRSPAAG